MVVALEITNVIFFILLLFNQWYCSLKGLCFFIWGYDWNYIFIQHPIDVLFSYSWRVSYCFAPKIEVEIFVNYPCFMTFSYDLYPIEWEAGEMYLHVRSNLISMIQTLFDVHWRKLMFISFWSLYVSHQ